MTWLASTWTAVWPNLLASMIWAAPAFTTHHLLIRRHIDKQHRRLSRHIEQVASQTTSAPQDCP